MRKSVSLCTLYKDKHSNVTGKNEKFVNVIASCHISPMAAARNPVTKRERDDNRYARVVYTHIRVKLLQCLSLDSFSSLKMRCCAFIIFVL